MWVKITPDMELMMEIDLQGVDEHASDTVMQLYDNVVRDALAERLKKVFTEEDFYINSVDIGVAREKYHRPKAA